MSLQSFASEVESGTTYLVNRLLDAKVWLAHYDQMQASLGQTKYLLPKVQLGKDQKKDMIAALDELPGTFLGCVQDVDTAAPSRCIS